MTTTYYPPANRETEGGRGKGIRSFIVRSIETRLRKIEGAMGIDEQPVFIRAERRGDEIGIRLPDTGEWMSLQEAKESPQCKNVIAFDEEHQILLWRPRHFKWCNLVMLAYSEKE